MFALFTDTDTDITPEVAEEYGYNLISMPYSVDGKEIFPYVDFKSFESHVFYQSLREGTMPKTSAISVDSYLEYFEPFFKEGKDILYVHFSAAMTMTFQAMDQAVNELLKRYPDRKFYSIDTKGITICSYNIVREVGDMYKAGKSAEEIVEWANNEVDKFAVYFFAEDLTFFGKSGRVSNFAAFMGNILGIKPIIYMGEDGKMTSIAKCRGKKQTLTKIVEYVKNLQDDITSHRVIIGHTDALELATTLGEMLKKEINENLNIEYVVVNPTAGSHCGPDAVGVCFHAIHR